MLINGIDISSLGVKLYDRILNSNSIYTVDDWLDGDIQPTNIRQQEKFRYMKLSFLVLGTDEQDAFYRISRLTKELKKATLIFDDINLSFDVSVFGAADTKRLKNGNFIVSYNLHSDYAKGSREIYTTNANLTNAFKLNLLYYQNSTQLLSSESITIRASSFTGVNDTLASIGINVDKYLPDYYNHGVATNIGGLEINYANLQYLGTLIINYAPIQYNLSVLYMIDNGQGVYNDIITDTITFTYPQLQTIQSIGQLVKPQEYKPDGYKSQILFNGDLTVENILSQSPLQILYEKIENARSKNILVGYYQEDDDGNWEQIVTQIVNVNETQFYDGLTLENIININAQRPNQAHYNEGYIVEHNNNELITYNDLEVSYNVRYPRAENLVFVEYYAGLYPDWARITTATISTKYKDSYENDFSLSQLGIDIDRYHTSVYEGGRIYNTGSLDTYDNVISAGVIQVYYKPIDYEITVNFYTEDDPTTPNTQTFTINDMDFLIDSTLNDIIPIGDYRPEGYQLDPDNSYQGEITLSALTQASPITIMFKEIEAERTKNILIHYKQELSSIFSALNTSLITVNESDCVGGVRLRDIINLNLYKPTYYEDGIIDNYSSSAVVQYDDFRSEYNVLYMASSYSTPVRYYTDEVNDANWIGSSSISYRVIDFETSTTLLDLGLNINAMKPSYCDDGVVQYRGGVNFGALRELQSIDVVYATVEEPTDDDDIDYPHRFLFLQHNDLGDYEGLHPEWTMNHAYINTGVTAQDMSKLTVIMECKRVDENVPLHNVNGAYGYLFGASSGSGSYFMRFNNQTQYHSGELTGVNTYEAKAGYYSDQLTLTETNAIGWSENSGIYASAREGYSNATFTYTNPLQTENVKMTQPLYLFANNNAGRYEYGLAGIGIYGCRIYYDNILIRDMIPVQTYDKIGDLVAPSNCLYDKITKTFFEDATGMNSFNIIDDDRYEDDNPEHKIGFCYVNYLQGESRFRTNIYYFRASDFIDKEYEPYTEWEVEEYQPSYYKPGVITDYNNIEKSFDGLNTRIFNVVYEEDENQIVVNYYKDTGFGEPELLQTETIQLKEKDFYQVPTFGDIVRLNKYKPEGYKTDYVFPEPKVSLARVLNHSPYDIIYTQEPEALEDYTTTVRYIKKVYGIRTYETIGDITLHFDQTDFRDGEYIDFYINKNAMKPERFYKDGECYQWYEMDERLTAPEDLKEVYIIMYDCETQSLDVNYYTDDIDPANLVASTSWEFRLDDFDPEYPFYLADQLPNNYINKYRPGNCDGGILQNSNTQFTFLTLVELDEIAIVYDTIIEPHDPTEAYYEKKILYWGDMCNRVYPSENEIKSGLSRGVLPYPYQVPYIDLGYRPKEIGRLRVEYNGASKPIGVNAPTSGYSYYADDYTTIFGYAGPPFYSIKDMPRIAQVVKEESYLMDPAVYLADNTEIKLYLRDSLYSLGSKGFFGIKPRMPSTAGAYWIYTANGPSSIDGQSYASNTTADLNIHNVVYYTKPGMKAGFRRGNPYSTDDNYNPISVFNNYIYSKDFTFDGVLDKETDGYMQINGAPLQAVGLNSYDDNANWGGQEGTWEGDYFFANPFTVVLDAYNNYCSIWNYHDSNTPFTWQIEDNDNPIWEEIERPRGSLSLFTSTNPTTGKPNYLNDIYWSFPFLGGLTGSFGLQFGQVGIKNDPYSVLGDEAFSIMIEAWELLGARSNINVGDAGMTTGTVEGGDDLDNPKSASGKQQVRLVKREINCRFGDWMFPTFPWQAGGILWGLKIYDQDRLVRDLIPVAKGDQIYDYIMPENGLFDLVTEIFFTDSNPGEAVLDDQFNTKITYTPCRLYVVPDVLSYGKITTNYYDYDNTFIEHKFIDVPTWFCGTNTTIEEVLAWNDYKPDDYHLDGWLDVDQDWSWWGEKMNLAQIYEMGAVNVYYRLRTFSKTVVYYYDNVRIGSRDLFYSLEDIQNANTLADLGVNVNLYQSEYYKPGRLVYNEEIIADDDIETFINAPSPIVIYDKYTQQEKPDYLYVEYYRGGAYDNGLITLDENDNNYLDCDLTARVLNPYGAIKYYNHYHQALYEDENFGEFIPYQVRVIDKYAGLHNGPARRYKTLAMIIERDTYTIIQERNGWGRLKEYPNAWILLTATEPITGPGQNPEYDVADSTVATIPFGEYVDITKMTIDRLWCYAPDVDSWIKAEDISFNQAGKLFNGLAIEVIELNEIDFNGINSLAEVGIDVQKYKLRFHQDSNYTYNGTYNYSSFSQLHEIDIVYPETIYNYSCVYYKDNKAEANRLGASAFSCSISDWNPDWDTFISTSWQTEEVYGEATVIGTAATVNIRKETDMNSELVGTVAVGESISISGPSVEINTYTWYPVVYRNYSGYIRDVNLNVSSEYGGTRDVNPTLYRDTVLTLTWEYFGFARNLYRPNGYGEGIYLWNPRSWDKDNIKFSFEELIRCGTQYIVYPIFDPDTYKIWVQGNYLNSSYVIQPYRYYLNNPGIEIDLSDNQHSSSLYPTEHYSVYAAGEWRNDLGYSTNFTSIPGYYYINPDKNAYYNTRMGEVVFNYASGLKFNGLTMPFNIGYHTYNNNVPDAILNVKNGDVLIGDYSNYRYSPTGVVGIGNDYENREREYYIYGNINKLQDNFNLSGYHRSIPTNSNVDLSHQWCRGVIYEVISYYDFMMIHYYVPVPKGLWYRYNGVEMRMPDNGLFDLLTGEFKQGFRAATDGNRTSIVPVEFSTSSLEDGKELIFLRNQDINKAEPYDLFNGWGYTTTDVSLYKKTTSATFGYSQPDEYSVKIRDLTQGLLLPVTKQTSDAANGVVGDWDKSCDQWIKRSELEATTLNGVNIYPEEATYALVPGTISNFYVYNDPTNDSDFYPLGKHSDYYYGSSPAAIKVYYVCPSSVGGLLFDGAHWIPREYTSSQTLPLNKNYVISTDTHYYSLPIADNEYRKGTYLYGERITVLYVCKNNQNWGYTGQGWIELDGHTSEVL